MTLGWHAGLYRTRALLTRSARRITRTVAYCLSRSCSSLGMPAANQTPPTLRISNTGLSQLEGGAGDRTSSILKSPLPSSATPAGFELWAVAVAAGPQNRVACTL